MSAAAIPSSTPPTRDARCNLLMSGTISGVQPGQGSWQGQRSRRKIYRAFQFEPVHELHVPGARQGHMSPHCISQGQRRDSMTSCASSYPNQLPGHLDALHARAALPAEIGAEQYVSHPYSQAHMIHDPHVHTDFSCTRKLSTRMSALPITAASRTECRQKLCRRDLCVVLP